MAFYKSIIHNSILFGSSTALNADTQTWISNVAAAGGTISRLDILAVDAAITYATAQGIWSSLDRVNFRCGDFIACKVAAKTGGVAASDTDFGSSTHFTVDGSTYTVSGITVTPTAGATYTNNGITFTVKSASITTGAGTVSVTANGVPSGTSGTLTKASGTGDATITFSNWWSDYTEAGGMRGNGATKALSTNYTPSAGGGNPLGDIAVFFAASPVSINRSAALAIGGGNTYGFQQSTSAPRALYGLGGQVALGGVFSPGVWHLSRTSNTLLTAYLNGVSQGTTATTASGAASALALPMFCRNNAGTGDQFSDHAEIGYALSAAGLNSTQAAALYNMFLLANGPSYLNRLPVLPGIFVSTSGNDFTGNGTTGNRYATLQKAIAAGSLSGNYNIVIADGTYAESTMQGSTSITAATGNGVNMVITVAGTFADGQRVAVTSAAGNTAANNLYTYAQVTGQSAGTIALYSDQALITPIVGNGTYTGSGVLAAGLGYLSVSKNLAANINVNGEKGGASNVNVLGTGLVGNNYNFALSGTTNNITWNNIKFGSAPNSLYAVELQKSTINGSMTFNNCPIAAPNVANACGMRMSGNGNLTITLNNCPVSSPNASSLAGIYQNGANVRTQINNVDTTGCASKGIWAQQGVTQILGGVHPFVLIGVDNFGASGQQVIGSMIGSSISGTGEPLLIGGGSLNFGVYSVRSVGGESIVLKASNGAILRNSFGGDGTSNPILLKGALNSDINSCTFSGTVSATNDAVITNYDGVPAFKSYGNKIKYCLAIAKGAANIFNWSPTGEFPNPPNIIDRNGYNIEGSGNYGLIENTANCASLAAVRTAWGSGPANQSTNDANSGSLVTVSYNSGVTGQVRYFVLRDATGNNTWNQVTRSFEKTNTANWLIYALPLYEDTAGSKIYVAPFPSEVPAGTVSADQYSCSAWSLQASTDTKATTQIIVWAG